MSDHKIKITKTFTVTMKDTFYPGSSDTTAPYTGEAMICIPFTIEEATKYHCDIATWNNTKLTLTAKAFDKKPESKEVGPKVGTGPTGVDIKEFGVDFDAEADCSALIAYTWESKASGTADDKKGCAGLTPKIKTAASPSFSFEIVEIDDASTAAAAKQKLADYKEGYKTTVVGMSFANADKRELVVATEAATLKEAETPASDTSGSDSPAASTPAATGADVVATTMAIALSAAAALF